MTAHRRPPHVSLRLGHRHVAGKGFAHSRWNDIYHLSMSASWPALIVGYLLAFITINLVFTGLYLLDPQAVTGARPPTSLEVFFFSIEVFGTVSFGGFLPGSPYGHALASFEILCGIVSYAFVTGMTFARFTRPKAELVFARNPVIARQDGRLMLITRVANRRHNYLTDVQAKLWIIANEVRDGRVVSRRFHRARLVRDDNPVLLLSWLLYHVIDEDSLLANFTEGDCAARDVSFAYIVSGHDESFAQEIHAHHMYHHSEVRWHHAFVETVQEVAPGEVQVDFSKFHDTEPLVSEAAA